MGLLLGAKPKTAVPRDRHLPCPNVYGGVIDLTSPSLKIVAYASKFFGWVESFQEQVMQSNGVMFSHELIPDRCPDCRRLFWAEEKGMTYPSAWNPHLVFPKPFHNKRGCCNDCRKQRQHYARMKHYYNNEAVKILSRPCLNCETQFLPSRNDAKFCKSSCRVAHHRKMKRSG